jgi:AAA family ATP:ADP antiporter
MVQLLQSFVAAWRRFQRAFLDIRPGEHGRALSLALYLLFVLFAYYILKPVSRSLFVNKFELDKLPLLYILIAPAGGIMAYIYSRLAVRASLVTAVNWATGVCIGLTVLMGILIRTQWTWTYYAFNIWVSMFSILLVTQGWVIAANIFTAREAKRLYGLLGLGAVIGAGFGGTFTSMAVHVIGENNLITASAAITGIAYLMFRLLLRQPGVNLQVVKATAEGDVRFSLADIGRDVRRYSHLQVIVGIVILTFIVDVMVEFQFQAFAKARFQGTDLTAFMGRFNGIYLNLVNFVFQFFLTAAMLRVAGVGGVLQIMPVTIAVASLGIYLKPGLLTSSLARLSEAATRYTFNRTGMELLYLPLPLELRNRVKAFIDIFVDRLGRGIGGLVLLLFTVTLDIPPKELSLLVLVFCAAWSFLSWRAQKEYLQTLQRRLEARTLDITGLRVSASDPAMVRLLENAARQGSARQAVYALETLRDAPGYREQPLVRELADSPHPEVRAAAFDMAREAHDPDVLPLALREIRQSRAGVKLPSIAAAVRYAIAESPEGRELTIRLLQHPSNMVTEAALDALVGDPVEARQVLPSEEVEAWAKSEDPQLRQRAAIALEALGDGDTPLLHELLADPDPEVAEAAIRTAGVLRKRPYLYRLVKSLGHPRLRKAATDALIAFGPAIAGTLRDLMEDTELAPSVRNRLPRILGRMHDQRAADELLGAIHVPDLQMRSSVVHELARMRREAPHLSYGPETVHKQILEEARSYYALWSALQPFREAAPKGPTALLGSTLEARLAATLDRMFHLLGLKYPPDRMRSVYRALQSKSPDDHSAAIEFLDSVLDRDLKRYLMPLVEDAGRLSETGQTLFGIEPKTAETALRELMQTGDVWLVSCAAASAAELGISGLRDDMESLRGKSGVEVDRVLDRATGALR